MSSSESDSNRSYEGQQRELLRSWIADDANYCCPGESLPITKAVHLARLRRQYPKCRSCPHRDDAAAFSRQEQQSIIESWNREPVSGAQFEDGIRGVMYREFHQEMLGELLDRVKSERGPGPAVHARELVLQVYRFAAGKGVEVVNPAEALARKAYATFVPRERNLSRHEIKALLEGLEQTGTAATLRLAVRFMLLTGVRKGEFIGATWSEVDWERAQWSIPAERMKAGKPHTVYLAEQALDILTTLRPCFPSIKYVHPSRYDSAEPLSHATLNRTIAAAVDRINADRKLDQAPFLPVSVHDLRRTFSSRLNDALFPEALVEACLAHQKKDQIAAAYNHARLSGPRRALMQVWADMLDCWLRDESAREVIVAGKAKIDVAAHDAEGMNL